VEQNGDQLTGVGIDLVGKVLDARTATQANNRVAVATWNYRST
jgi:hypothetical protein